MGTQAAIIDTPTKKLVLQKVASFPGLRVLAWNNNVLYAADRYKVLRSRISGVREKIIWEAAGEFHPSWWRQRTSRSRLSMRLFRDGFHVLAVSCSGALIGAVAGAIVRLGVNDSDFRVTHRIGRGTRPLHIASTPEGQLFWGEYFNNPERQEVHIYGSSDEGLSWNVAYSFPARSIRHVHNIVYDHWGDCLWILTGDDDSESRILRATTDLKDVDVASEGNQQARAAALIVRREAIYFSTDTPFATNQLYRLDRQGGLTVVGELDSSSTYGCQVGDSMFFSTMAEPSSVNCQDQVHLYGSSDGMEWHRLAQWRKDCWSPKLFQYGNVFLPDGYNDTDCLALTTIGVKGADCETSFWRVVDRESTIPDQPTSALAACI